MRRAASRAPGGRTVSTLSTSSANSCTHCGRILVIRRPAVCRLNDTRGAGSRPMLAKRLAGRSGRSLQPSLQSMCQRHREALAWPWLGPGLALRWHQLGCFAMHGRDESKSTNYTRNYARLGAGRVRNLLIRAPTTKLRKTDSRYLFCATAGRQMRRHGPPGLDQIGSSRHG